MYPVGSKEGTPGTAKIDYKNPDSARQKTPLMGLQIMEGFQFSGDNIWKNGNIYDPDSGKTYSSKITMVRTTNSTCAASSGYPSWAVPRSGLV